MFPQISKRFFVQRRFALGHTRSEIDDPLVRPAAGHVHAVNPGLQNVSVCSAVRIGWQAQPFSGQIASDIEGAAFFIGFERSTGVSCQTLDAGDIDSDATAKRGQISMNPVNRHTVKLRWLKMAVGGVREAHQGDPNRRTVDHPRFIAPRFENSALVGRGLERTAVCSPRMLLVATSPARLVLPQAICCTAFSNQ